MDKQKLTNRCVEALLPKAQTYFQWCGQTPGFSVRVFPSGKKIFYVQMRVAGGTRRKRIAEFGTFTVEEARKRALKIRQSAADGVDPRQERESLRQSKTVAQVCEVYLAAAKAGLVTTRFRRPKRPSTVAIDEGRIVRHIVPLIGKVSMLIVRSSHIQRMADDIAAGKTAGIIPTKRRGKAVVTGGPGTAARVVELLGGIFTWAQKRGYHAGSNPAWGISTVKGQPKDRVLSEKEFNALGQAIDRALVRAPKAASALMLIAVTGLRREEACALKWDEIDGPGQCLRLENTKTGRSVRPIGAAAINFLNKLPRISDTFVFPTRNGKRSADLKRAFADIFNAADLKDARAHDLRRSFASWAADLGYSDATIGELIGHARRGVTARYYIRRPDAALATAANAVSSRIYETLTKAPAASAGSLEFREAA